MFSGGDFKVRDLPVCSSVTINASNAQSVGFAEVPGTADRASLPSEFLGKYTYICRNGNRVFYHPMVFKPRGRINETDITFKDAVVFGLAIAVTYFCVGVGVLSKAGAFNGPGFLPPSILILHGGQGGKKVPPII